MSHSKIILVFNLVLNSVLSARILGLFPVPSISHQVVFRALTMELVKRGHKLTVMTPDPAYQKGDADKPENLSEIDVHDISYGLWREKIVCNVNGANAFEITKIAIKTCTDIFEMQINSEAFQEALKNNSDFDLIITEACMRSTLVFSNIYKVPVVQVSSLGATPYNYKSFGIPAHPLIYPDIMSQKLYNLTVWDKIRELYNKVFSWYLVWDENYENEMLRRNFGENVPSISELSSIPDLLILNLHSMWDSNRPVSPGVVQVNGLHLQPRKDLPKDLKSFLDASKHGVIYMSFGTNFDLSATLPEKVEKFNKVFARLPYNVIWKWDKEVMPGKAHNVRLTKWIPQADLLHHPNIKAFITQAGLQSTDEAINAQVPLIALPTAADQWYNAEQYKHYKIGVHLDLLSFTEDELYDAITTVIEDKSYLENIRKLSSTLRDTPDTALNTSVWWIEYVIRHGGAKHLRSRAAGVSWSEYLMLDVVFTVLVILVMCLVVVIFAIHCTVGRFKKIKQKPL